MNAGEKALFEVKVRMLAGECDTIRECMILADELHKSIENVMWDYCWDKRLGEYPPCYPAEEKKGRENEL